MDAIVAPCGSPPKTQVEKKLSGVILSPVLACRPVACVSHFAVPPPARPAPTSSARGAASLLSYKRAATPRSPPTAPPGPHELGSWGRQSTQLQPSRHPSIPPHRPARPPRARLVGPPVYSATNEPPPLDPLTSPPGPHELGSWGRQSTQLQTSRRPSILPLPRPAPTSSARGGRQSTQLQTGAGIGACGRKAVQGCEVKLARSWRDCHPTTRSWGD